MRKFCLGKFCLIKFCLMRKFCLFDLKILFPFTFIILTQKLGKCLYEKCLGARIPHSILVYNLLAIEIKILFLKLTMSTSMPLESWTRMELGIFDSHTNPYRHFSNF